MLHSYIRLLTMQQVAKAKAGVSDDFFFLSMGAIRMES